MAFYLVKILGKCQHWAGCKKPAMHEVRSSGTVVYGKFCLTHAQQKQRLL